MDLIKRLQNYLKRGHIYFNSPEYYGYLVDNFSISNVILNSVQNFIPGVTQNNTEIPISIHSFNKNSNIRQVRKAMGKERALFENKEYGKNYTILFYNIRLYKFSAILQLHFYNQVLFFGKYIIQNTSSKIKESIKQMISMKYQVDILENNTVIKDAIGSFIHIHNEASVEVDYFVDNSIIEHFRTQQTIRNNEILQVKNSLFLKSMSKL